MILTALRAAVSNLQSQEVHQFHLPLRLQSLAAVVDRQANLLGGVGEELGRPGKQMEVAQDHPGRLCEHVCYVVFHGRPVNDGRALALLP